MAGDGVERELKLGVDDDFELPSLDMPAVTARDRGVRQMEATYWDTASLDLARHGYGLRHRTDKAWTLKSPSHAGGAGGDVMVRGEEEFDGPPAHPPAAVLARIAAVIGPAPLIPVVTMRAARRAVVLEDDQGEEFAEVVHDRVTVVHDGEVTGRFAEVEVELPNENDPRLAAVVERLRAAGAHEPAGPSKYLQALAMTGRSVAGLD